MNTRQISILRDLLLQDGYVTGQDLAMTYGVSTKTAYADIALINEALSIFHVKIEKKPRHGVRLLVNSEEKRQIVEFLSYNQQEYHDEASLFQRERDIIKELVLGSGLVDIIDWSTTHFISEASIRRDLDRLEQQLSEYDIRLERKSGQVYLAAKEESVRKFFRNYLVQHLDLASQQNGLSQLELFFEKGYIEQVQETVRSTSATYHFKISEQYCIYLILDLLISSHRYWKHSFIADDYSTVMVENLSQYEVYVVAGELLSTIIGVSMPLVADAEIRYICYTLLSVGYETQLVHESDMEETVLAFIERVSQLSSVDFTQDEHLFRMLVNHIRPMFYRLKSGINIKNRITEDIKTRYSVLYYIVWLASKTLSEEYEVEMMDAEIAFLTIYFEIAVEKMSKPLTIYVICPHGLATSELIMSSLRRTISSFDFLVNVDLKELTAEKVEQADLIISSIQLEDFPRDYILVSPIVTDHELELIQQTYTNLTKGNRNMLSAVRDSTVFSKSVILDLLKDKVLLNRSCRTVEECIELMVKHTSSKNRTSKPFLQSVLAREKLGSTSVYTGIALPHADPAFVKESELVMLTLDKPIEWGQNLISVVVLIAIAEKDEELYKKALIGLYSKIDTKAYVDTLADSQTPSEFIASL